MVDLLQAAVDVGLALLRLGFGIAHFAGRMLGILGHVLHAISNFVDRCRHLFHLQRLLLAALLRLHGVAAHFARSLAQTDRGQLQLGHDPTQLGGEGIEMRRQLGDFVAAVGFQAAGQIAFAAGDIGHGLDSGLERPGDAASYHDQQCRHHQNDAKADRNGLDHLLLEFGLNVIDIHAGTENPAPRGEQRDVGGFLHGFAGARLRPAIVDHACALGLGHGNDFIEYLEAIRVFYPRQVLPHQLGAGRVHDHHWTQVVDPEVVGLVVTQAAKGIHRLLLSLIASQRAGSFQAMVVVEQAAGGLHHMHGLLCLGVIQVVVDLLEHGHSQRGQHQHSDDED